MNNAQTKITVASYTVNVITEPVGINWILSRMAKESIRYVKGSLTQSVNNKADINYFMDFGLVNEKCRGYESKVTQKIDNTADINYFMNYHLYQPCKTKTAAYFTHIVNDGKTWKIAEQNIGLGIYMCDKYKPRTKLSAKIIAPGLSQPKINEKLIIGVSGTISLDNNRKCPEEIKWLYDELNYCTEWRFMGRRWKEIIPNIKIQEWQSDQKAAEFYKGLDVYITMSKQEGGPVPILEAVKCGVKVICKDVGASELWRNYATFIKTKEEARAVLARMIDAKKERAILCAMDWDWYAREHRKAFDLLMSN